MSNRQRLRRTKLGTVRMRRAPDKYDNATLTELVIADALAGLPSETLFPACQMYLLQWVTEACIVIARRTRTNPDVVFVDLEHQIKARQAVPTGFPL